MHAGFAKALRGAWDLLKPRDNLTVTQWADRYRYVQSGKYYSATTPFMREVMDCASDPSIGEIVLVKGAQISGTTVMENVAGYYIAHQPRSILMVMETVDKGQSWSKDRLEQMEQSSFPRTFASAASRNSRNTMLFKQYRGGDIAIVGANAPAGLSSRARNLLLMDEISRYPDSASGEGDVVALARVRTKTFPNALTFLTSTPTVSRRILGADGSPVILPSKIFQAYNETDKREWFCKCPRCDDWATLKWENVRWEEHSPKTAHYVCQACKAELSDSDRFKMAMNGEWRKGADVQGKAGFWINGLATPFPPHAGYVSVLHEYAFEFIKSKHDPEKRKVFKNTVEALDFLDYGTTPDTKGLFDRREDIEPDALPDHILCLTATVDVQGDRLELQICGWGEGEECWIIGHWILPGNPQKPDVWRDLDSELDRRFKTKSGITLTIQCTLIDSGDGKSQKDVYRFVIPRQRRKVYASKGEGRIGAPLVVQTQPTKFAKRREPVWLVHIGTDTAKDMVFTRCELTDIGPKYVHFSKSLNAEWFNQLSAEEQKTVTVAGRTETRWEQIRARNEALDCFVMNLAAVTLLRPQWETLKGARKSAVPEDPKPEAETVEPKLDPWKGLKPNLQPAQKPVKAPRVSRFTNWRR